MKKTTLPLFIRSFLLNKILYSLIFILSAITYTKAQAVFRHVTNSSNINGNSTILDHPQLNGNPGAIIFILPNWNVNGSDIAGVSYSQNAGVWYNGTHWTIFNENRQAPMPENLTFNVLVSPANNPNSFTVTCTAESKIGWAHNTMVINHNATNNKPRALLLVTQNRDSIYNDNSQLVSYSNGRWFIANNNYFSNDPVVAANSLLPVGARFNVMVVENGVVPGFPNAVSFLHTANSSNIIPAGQQMTFLDHQGLNGKRNTILFATANWGWGEDSRPDESGIYTSGPYNDSPLMSWYDHPDDVWNYKNDYWSIYNANSTPMREYAKINVIAIDPGPPTELVAQAFKHIATPENIRSNWTIIDHELTNDNPGALLQVTPDYRVVYNESVVGVWYSNGRWNIFNQDLRPIPVDIRHNVMVENPSSKAFLHTATAVNTSGHITTLDHPLLNGNPNAVILVTQNWGNNGPYNPNEVGVWYNGSRWTIYNENLKAMPVNAKFNVSIQTGRAVHHTATSSNIWGTVLSATETLASDHEKFVFLTHNYGEEGPYNPNPTGVYYPPGRNSWSILTGNTAAMPVGARFNLLSVTANIPTNFVETTPLNITLNQLTYDNGDIASCNATRLSDLDLIENKYVVYVSPKTKDTEVVEIRSTDGVNFQTISNTTIRTNGDSTPNDGVLRTEAGEIIAVYYMFSPAQKGASSQLPDFVSDFGLIAGQTSESPVVINSAIALSDNESNEQGEIVSGTLMAGSDAPIEIAAGQVIFYGPNQQELDRFLSYSSGTILGALPMNDTAQGQMYLIGIDLSQINLSNLPQIRTIVGSTDSLRGSNTEVLKLVQFCMQSQLEGFMVSPNPKVNSTGAISEGNCMEEWANPNAVAGESNPSGFGTAIPQIWNYMAIWDKDNERINVGIIDYGFYHNLDYSLPWASIPQCHVYFDSGIHIDCSPNAAAGPPTTRSSGVGGFEWHGNAVWSRIGAVLNNGPLNADHNSTAGVAGQVARPVLIKMGGQDAYAFGIATAIRAAVDRNAQVINISGGYPCRILTNILGWAPNICSESGRLEICAAVGHVVFGAAFAGCEALRFFCPPPCPEICHAGVFTALAGYTTACIAQIALGNPPNAMHEAIQYAKSRGVPVVASAGNFMSRENFSSLPAEIVNRINWDQNRQTVEEWHLVPAILEDVICVGAASVSPPYANTQVFGNRVDVWGPEDGHFLAPSIVTAEPPGGYVQVLKTGFNGTSSAAPFITGLIANAMAVNPLLNPGNTALTPLQRSQIPSLMKGLLSSTAYPRPNIFFPTDPTGRRRNLVNPFAFIKAANEYQNGGTPIFERYTDTYNLSGSEEHFDGVHSRTVDGSLYRQSVIPGAIVYIPSGGNGASPIVDKDYFSLHAPSDPGQYTTELVLTTPRGDRYGNLVIRGEGLQLVSTMRLGSNEDVKTYRIPHISAGHSYTFSVEGERPTDDNLYELVVKTMTSPSYATDICRGNTARLEEGIYSIRLHSNNKALDAPDHSNVHLWDYHGGNNQLWYIKPVFEYGRQVHIITNLAYGNNLIDNSIDYCDGVDNGEYVHIQPFDSKWLIESAGSNSYLIRTPCGTYDSDFTAQYQLVSGAAATYQQNGGRVVFQQCDGNSNSNRWNIRRIRHVFAVNYSPSNIVDLCPYNLVAGDHEFNGNGPRLTGRVNLSITPDGRRVEARIDITARETGGDQSEVRGSWVRTLYTAPSSMRIMSINSSTSVNIDQLLQGGGRNEFWQGCDGDEHVFNVGFPLLRMAVVGDTGGGDISGDANCHCDTRINRIEFGRLDMSLTTR